MLVGQAIRLALLGIAAGVVISAALMPLLANQLYAVQPRDPITLTGIPLALLVVAIVAALIPARRAMRIDPRTAPTFKCLVPVPGNEVPSPELLLQVFERLLVEALLEGAMEMEIE